MANLDLQWLEAVLSHNREGMEHRAVFLQLWDEKMGTDAIAVLQVGMAVLMDKPFIVVAPPGSVLPENILRLARSVIYAGITDESLAQSVHDALEALRLEALRLEGLRWEAVRPINE